MTVDVVGFLPKSDEFKQLVAQTLSTAGFSELLTLAVHPDKVSGIVQVA